MSDVNLVAEEVQNPTDVKVTEQTGTHGAAGLANAKVEEPAANGTTEEGDRHRKDDRNGGNKRYNNDRNDRFRKKQKSSEDFSHLPETDDPAEIRDQVEFYFSVHNLSTDEHMFKELRGPRNQPVSVKHLATFKRMRRFQPYSAIVKALRESDSLVLVDDGEYGGLGNEGVKRKDPITIPGYDEKDKASVEELFSRFRKQSGNHLEASIYAKGFGDDDKAGQISIENFFKPYGSVVVRKRRDNETGKWKGSVFVEFESVEAKKQFLDLDPKPKFNGNELYIQGKKEYNEMKCAEKQIEPGSGRSGRGHDHHRHGGQGRGGRARGGRGGRGRATDRSTRFRRDHSDRRDQRRDRSGSRDADRGDWKADREEFQKSQKSRRDKQPESDEKFELPKDENGVPIVRDTRGEPEPLKTNKRKANEERESSPKKSKIEIKEDA